MKKILIEEGDEDKLEEFRDILDSYSDHRFVTYISIPEVQCIINIVYSEINVESFVENHRTLNLNKDSYISHINSIIKNM